MNEPSQNSAQMPDYLKARKLHLNGIIADMAGIKKLKARANKDTKVETLTIDAIKAELDFIDGQLKKGRVMKKRKPKKLPPRYILPLQKIPQIFRLLVCGGCKLMTASGHRRTLTYGFYQPIVLKRCSGPASHWVVPIKISSGFSR